MDCGGEAMLGTVKNPKRDLKGNPVGRSNMNPLLDTREYKVEFSDGSIDVLKPPIGFKETSCHLVFNIKSNTLAQKARFVAGGHQTDPPKDLMYSSVVS
jgi:hypothetical protein